MLRARQYRISSTYLCIHPAVKHSLGALGELRATPGEEEFLAVLVSPGAEERPSAWYHLPVSHQP